MADQVPEAGAPSGGSPSPDAVPVPQRAYADVQPPLPIELAIRCRCSAGLSSPLCDFEELNFESLLEARRCLATALQRVAPFQPQPQHECTSECWLFNHREAYICVRSDNIHLCVAAACDRMILSPEGIEVCPLTGKVFGGDLRFSFSDNPQCASGYAESQRARGATVTQPQQDRLRFKLKVPKELAEPKPKKEPREKPDTSSAVQTKLLSGWMLDQSAITNFMIKLLPRVGEAKRKGLMLVVHGKWQNILSTKAFREAGSTYTIQSHTLAVLRCMADGGYPDIPSDASLQCELPSFRDLPTALPVEGTQLCRNHTARWKQFHAFMQSWRDAGRPTSTSRS